VRVADRAPWVAQYLPELIRQGLSATQGLNLFRSPPEEGGLGQGVSTSEWYRQWSQTLNRLSQAEGFMAVNLNLRPTADQLVQFSSRRATGLNYTFDVLVRNRATGETYYTPSGYRTDTPVSFRKAKQGAMDALTLAAAEGSPSVAALDIIGALPVSVVQYVPGG